MNKIVFDKIGLSYSQAVKISEYSELLFISGQVPEHENGTLSESFEEQCRQAWSNVDVQLKKACLGLKDLIKVTIYLSDRKYRELNSKIRQEILKDISPALTIIIAGIYEEEWLLEIEAVAAK